MNPRPLGFLVTTSLLACSSFAFAQDLDSPVKDLRAEFIEELEAASSPVTEIYIKALAELEMEMASKREYEVALAARLRRERLETFLDTTSVTLSPIYLPLEDARTSGKIQRDGGAGLDAKTLSGWKTAGSSATWDVQGITPGTYQVQIEYSCGPSVSLDKDGDGVAESERFAGGSIFFEEVTNLAGADGTRLTADIESTGSWGKFEALALGEIQIQRTSATFKLVASDPEPLGTMNLKSVDLIPKGAASAEQASPLETDRETLAGLKEDHASRLASLRIPIAKKYIDDIRAMVRELPEEKRSQLAPFIEKEALRAMEFARADAEYTDSPTTVSAGASADGLESVHALKNARWIEDPKNLGDVFMVEHDGRKFPVRIFFASCPTPKVGDKRSAQYFGISEEDAGVVGTDAARFTANYLEGRNLTIFTSGAKDSEGNVLAIVSMRGIGVYARIMVARGLAMINEELNLSYGSVTATEYVENSLRPTEEKAKAGGRGAWSFHVKEESSP